MALSLGTLTAYTEQNKQPLIVKSIFGAKTVSLMNKQAGIKSSETINILETDAQFQNGAVCGFNASGVTSITQRTITVGDIKVEESICPKSLNAYYIQKELQAGSQPEKEKIPFEQIYAEEKVAKIVSQLETAVWQGNTSSTNPNLARFDGLVKLIDAATGVITATAQASVSSSTVRGIFEDIYNKIPAALLDKEDLRVFCGWDVFRILINKLTTDNLYHYTADDAARSGEMYYPGTTLRIVAVHGLNSMNVATTSCIFAMRTSNMYFGTDLMDEEERFEIFYAKEADEVRYRAAFKAGVQIAFPFEIVKYANS